MKTRTEIIRQIEEGIQKGMNKFYLNGLLFALGRNDLCIIFSERMTEKRVNKILEELKLEDKK
ncbi:MAG: hypothetical protein WCX82_04910 [archaeon]|jgi:hypothetical protein